MGPRAERLESPYHARRDPGSVHRRGPADLDGGDGPHRTAPYACGTGAGRRAVWRGASHPAAPGQGIFRVLVTDDYRRCCAVTGERTLPVLAAAHVRPYAEGGGPGPSDLHTLVDRGYVTITPDYRLEVSRRIRDEFENGRDY